MIDKVLDTLVSVAVISSLTFIILAPILSEIAMILLFVLLVLSMMSLGFMPLICDIIDYVTSKTKYQRLENALNANDFRQARKLLDAGANPNAHHGKLLITTVCRHNFGAAKLLIDYGADVNLENGRILSGVVDSCSKDARYCAVRFLLDYGADVHARNEYALFRAYYKDNYPLMTLLLKHGADVHVNHEELLYSAMKYRDLEAVRILLKYGADQNALGSLLDYYTASMPELKELLDTDWTSEAANVEQE